MSDGPTRRHSYKACLNCRGKHMKCDGKEPCSRCTERGLSCTFVASRRGGSRRTKRGSVVNEFKASYFSGDQSSNVSTPTSYSPSTPFYSVHGDQQFNWLTHPQHSGQAAGAVMAPIGTGNDYDIPDIQRAHHSFADSPGMNPAMYQIMTNDHIQRAVNAAGSIAGTPNGVPLNLLNGGLPNANKNVEGHMGLPGQPHIIARNVSNINISTSMPQRPPFDSDGSMGTNSYKAEERIGSLNSGDSGKFCNNGPNPIIGSSSNSGNNASNSNNAASTDSGSGNNTGDVGVNPDGTSLSHASLLHSLDTRLLPNRPEGPTIYDMPQDGQHRANSVDLRSPTEIVENRLLMANYAINQNPLIKTQQLNSPTDNSETISPISLNMPTSNSSNANDVEMNLNPNHHDYLAQYDRHYGRSSYNALDFIFNKNEEGYKIETGGSIVQNDSNSIPEISKEPISPVVKVPNESHSKESSDNSIEYHTALFEKTVTNLINGKQIDLFNSLWEPHFTNFAAAHPFLFPKDILKKYFRSNEYRDTYEIVDAMFAVIGGRINESNQIEFVNRTIKILKKIVNHPEDDFIKLHCLVFASFIFYYVCRPREFMIYFDKFEELLMKHHQELSSGQRHYACRMRQVPEYIADELVKRTVYSAHYLGTLMRGEEYKRMKFNIHVKDIPYLPTYRAEDFRILRKVCGLIDLAVILARNEAPQTFGKLRRQFNIDVANLKMTLARLALTNPEINYMNHLSFVFLNVAYISTNYPESTFVTTRMSSNQEQKKIYAFDNIQTRDIGDDEAMIKFSNTRRVVCACKHIYQSAVDVIADGEFWKLSCMEIYGSGSGCFVCMSELLHAYNPENKSVDLYFDPSETFQMLRGFMHHISLCARKYLIASHLLAHYMTGMALLLPSTYKILCQQIPGIMKQVTDIILHPGHCDNELFAPGGFFEMGHTMMRGSAFADFHLFIVHETYKGDRSTFTNQERNFAAVLDGNLEDEYFNIEVNLDSLDLGSNEDLPGRKVGNSSSLAISREYMDMVEVENMFQPTTAFTATNLSSNNDIDNQRP